jgi:hypothetical protein
MSKRTRCDMANPYQSSLNDPCISVSSASIYSYDKQISILDATTEACNMDLLEVVVVSIIEIMQEAQSTDTLVRLAWSMKPYWKIHTTSATAPCTHIRRRDSESSASEQ